MSRLPNPGSDANSWGTLLNDYVQQSLAADGTLVTDPLNPHTGIANTNLASASKPGLTQLTNDLGGTAASPKVTGLQGYPVDATAPTNGYVLTWNSSTGKWQPSASAGGGGSGITQAQALAINSMRL
jgi:hypothetical protein